jgi:heme oxygenase
MIPAPHAMPPPAPGAARARLRAATRELHESVDGMFARGLDSRCSYGRYVLGMHRFAADYEIAVRALPRHSAWLADDLSRLALAPLSARATQRPAALAATCLGWEYVMAGSSMGARRMLRDACGLGYQDGTGATFLARHAVCDDWNAMRQRLDALDADDAPRMAQAEAGACAAFALVLDCFGRSFERIPQGRTGSPT